MEKESEELTVRLVVRSELGSPFTGKGPSYFLGSSS